MQFKFVNSLIFFLSFLKLKVLENALRLSLLTGIFFTTFSCLAQQIPDKSIQNIQSTVTVFVDVSIIPMDRERILKNQTVIVRSGRITKIGLSSTVESPPGALKIDGRGKFLIPGLTDMHVHIFDPDECTLYLANGVTTVRNMHGIPQHLKWREQIAKGELLGPRLFTAGPILDGDPPTRRTNRVLKTTEEAEKAVSEQKSAGYDFIKIYDNLPLDIYRAVISAARKNNMAVVGHLPTPVGLENLLKEKGQICIEHVEELLPLFDDARNTDKTDEIARKIAVAGIWIDPTLTVYASGLQHTQDWNAVLSRPEMKYLNPKTSKTWGWSETGAGRFNNPQALDRFTRINSFFEKKLIKALHKAGVKLLAGSDAPIPALVPGFALIEELRLLVKSGLTPYEAMVASTRNPAEFLGQAKEFGTIEIGKSADLVLLNENPLDDINQIANRAGVMVKGKWLMQKELQKSLDSLAESYKQISKNN